MPNKLHESEFAQHVWLKVEKKGNSLDVFIGSDGWESPFGKPKYHKITKIDFKTIELLK